MLKLLVLADDFTGALDTGVQFSSQGIHTIVTTNKKIDYKKIADDIEVAVIDTESRYLSFDEAYQLVSGIIEDAKSQGVQYFYKKIDSALRGNVSSEIKAFLGQFPNEKIAMVPAYPAFQRVVRQGKLYIGDNLVSESVFAKDPYEPVTESDIIKRLKQEAGIEASLVDKRQSLTASSQLFLFDSETERELEQIADSLAKEDLLHVSIGCAGFAKYLVQQLFPNKSELTAVLTAPLVAICGSVNPITKEQIEYAEKQHYLRLSLTPQELLEEHYWKSEQGQRKLEDYLTLMEASRLTIFETLSDATSQGLAAYGIKNNMDKQTIRFRIGQSLGELTEQLLEKQLDRTFLFTGGDTLFQSMQVLKIDQIRPLCELSPGIVLAELIWKNRSISVITKSGGFGRRELFEDINKMIQKEDTNVS